MIVEYSLYYTIIICKSVNSTEILLVICIIIVRPENRTGFPLTNILANVIIISDAWATKTEGLSDCQTQSDLIEHIAEESRGAVWQIDGTSRLWISKCRELCQLQLVDKFIWMPWRETSVIYTQIHHTHTRNRNYLELDSVIASKLRALPAKT